jgi:hypothetical protein
MLTGFSRSPGFGGQSGGQQMMQPFRPQTMQPTMQQSGEQRPQMPPMQQMPSPFAARPQQQMGMPNFLNHIQGQLPSFDQLSAQYPSFFRQRGIGQDQFNQFSNWWGQRPQGGDMGSWWQSRPGLSQG